MIDILISISILSLLPPPPLPVNRFSNNGSGRFFLEKKMKCDLVSLSTEDEVNSTTARREQVLGPLGGVPRVCDGNAGQEVCVRACVRVRGCVRVYAPVPGCVLAGDGESCAGSQNQSALSAVIVLKVRATSPPPAAPRLWGIRGRQRPGRSGKLTWATRSAGSRGPGRALAVGRSGAGDGEVKGRGPQSQGSWLLARRRELEVSRMAEVPEHRTLASAPRIAVRWVLPSRLLCFRRVTFFSSVFLMLSRRCGGVALILSSFWCRPRGNGHLYRYPLGFNERTPKGTKSPYLNLK